MTLIEYLPKLIGATVNPTKDNSTDIISKDQYQKLYNQSNQRVLTQQESDQLFNYLLNMQNKHIGGYYSWLSALPVCIFLTAMMFLMSYNYTWQVMYQSGSVIEIFNYYGLYTEGLISFAEFVNYIIYLLAHVSLLGVGAVLVSQFRHFLMLVYKGMDSKSVSILSCMYAAFIFYMGFMVVF